MTKNFRTTLSEQLNNPEFLMEWENLEVEYQITRSIIEARQINGITQKQLADITGIAQSDISKLENGGSNPSVKTLQRLAEGLGKRLVIYFK